MFASKTIVGHLARGILGLAALAGATLLAPAQPFLALALIPVALFALRGCPMCWTIGLIETIGATLTGRRADASCMDGSCAITRPTAGRPSKRAGRPIPLRSPATPSARS